MTKYAPTGQDWPDNMRPAVAAQYLGISDSKLAKLRMEANRQDSPPFIKISGCVIYRRQDLDEWLERHVVRSDSGASISIQPTAPRVRPRGSTGHHKLKAAK